MLKLANDSRSYPGDLGFRAEIENAELRRIARWHLGQHAPHDTLEFAALVNEAYLKSVRGNGIQCDNRLQFFALCDQIIRSILVDHARNAASAQRGGNAVRIPLNEEVIGPSEPGVEVLASLAKMDLRKSRLVELRYFGGLTIDEGAEVIGVVRKTAKRDGKIAKALLFAEPKPGKSNHRGAE